MEAYRVEKLLNINEFDIVYVNVERRVSKRKRNGRRELSSSV